MTIRTRTLTVQELWRLPHGTPIQIQWPEDDQFTQYFLYRHDYRIYAVNRMTADVPALAYLLLDRKQAPPAKLNFRADLHPPMEETFKIIDGFTLEQFRHFIYDQTREFGHPFTNTNWPFLQYFYARYDRLRQENPSHE